MLIKPVVKKTIRYSINHLDLDTTESGWFKIGVERDHFSERRKKKLAVWIRASG